MAPAKASRLRIRCGTSAIKSSIARQDRRNWPRGVAAAARSVDGQRAAAADSLHWLNVLGLAAAITYIAVSASAIAGQLLMVEWAKAGADLKTVLGAYILDTAAFTLSFEIAALFMLAVGIVLWTRGGALRVIGGSGILVGVVLFVTGFVGTASIQSPSSQIGFMAFSLWTLIAGIYLMIRPARIARAS